MQCNGISVSYQFEPKHRWWYIIYLLSISIPQDRRISTVPKLEYRSKCVDSDKNIQKCTKISNITSIKKKIAYFHTKIYIFSCSYTFLVILTHFSSKPKMCTRVHKVYTMCTQTSTCTHCVHKSTQIYTFLKNQGLFTGARL